MTRRPVAVGDKRKRRFLHQRIRNWPLCPVSIDKVDHYWQTALYSHFGDSMINKDVTRTNQDEVEQRSLGSRERASVSWRFYRISVFANGLSCTALL